MHTRIGDIKSIKDFFDLKREIINDPGTNGFGSVIEEEWRCKLCNDVIRGVSNHGAAHSQMIFVIQVAEKHIELHRLVSLIIP